MIILDKKIMAVIVVVILAVAAIGTVVALNSNSDNNDSDDVTYKDGAFNVVSRVNSEGSGLYIKSSEIEVKDGVPYRNGVPFYAVSGETYTVSESNAKAWAGLVFATPGVTSIQHTQIASLAQTMGLKFVLYTAGTSVPDNSIAYYTNLSNYSLITDSSVMSVIDAGIIWEPQYERIIQEKGDVFTSLALTNNLFPGHTCCVIIGNHNFINDNPVATGKFLAGYTKAVDFVNSALANKNSEDYKWLVEFTVKKTIDITEKEIQDAFDTITYLYADGTDGDLSKLKTDIAQLVRDLDSLGNITGKYSDAQTLADSFVDDSKLKDALKTNYDSSNSGTVRVAVITGDIHQIAVHVAIEKGYFKDLGLNVKVVQGKNGGSIATSMQNNSADFGFIGAPPATITTINSGLISA